jgi:hypothetical protein
MHAHAADFRSEVRDGDADALSEALLHDWRTAPLSEADRALCAHAEALALRPAAMRAADLEPLRAAGFDDRAIHDATQAIAYFSYINRVADGLGVDLEPGMPPPPGEEGLAPDAAEVQESLSKTGSLVIVWRCLRCNHHLPAGHGPPDACPSCGAPKTEFALVEED